MSRRPFRVVLIPLLTLAVLLPAAGCFEREEATCEYWVPKLTSVAKADKALENVKELKCKEAIPALEKLFDDGHTRLEIIRAIREIDARKESVALLKKALKNKQTAKIAVGIAVDWGITDVSEELKAIMTKPMVPDARMKALEALLKSEKARNLEDLLVKVMVEDLDFQDYRVNRRAIEELGKIQSVKSVPAMVQAAFMRGIKTGNKPALYQAVRTALAQIGPASVPVLISTIEEKNVELFRYARENGIFPWEITQGPEIMQLLTDSLDVRVVEPIADNIKDLNKPMGLNPAAEQRWLAAQQNRFTTAMLGMGAVVKDNTALDKLAKIVADTEADAMRQRLNAARIMAYIGTPQAQDKLLDLWENDGLWLERKSDMFRAALMVPLLEALDSTRLERFKKLVEKPSKRVAEKLKEDTVVAYLRAIETCKQDADCWISKVDSEDKWETVKACVMLMRGIGNQDKVGEAMFKRITKAKMSEVDMRRFPLMVLARTGGATQAKKLIEMAEQADRSDVYWPTEWRITAMALNHRAKAAGK